MRLFVGIELGDSLTGAIDQATARLRAHPAFARLPVRWVPRGNLHLTLAFLGEVRHADYGPLQSALERSMPVPSFELRIAGFGAFPASGPMHVIWMGVATGGDALTALHAEIDRRLAPLGFVSEARPYVPHLTIGRVRDGGGAAGRQAREALQQAGDGGGTARIASVALVRSRLSPSGAAYEVLLRVPLC